MTLVTQSDVASAIAQVNLEVDAAIRVKSVPRLAAIYTKDGKMYQPNGPILAGDEEIRSYWQGVLDLDVGSAKLETLELEVLGETAHEIGTYVMRSTDGVMIDQGKYLVVWKKEDGEWKYHRDMWNSSNPAQ